MAKLHLNSRLGCFTIFAIFLVLVCIGLYFQVVWSCAIPPSDPNIEVVVSACRNPHLYSVSPSGRYLVYGAQGEGFRLRDLASESEEILSTSGRLWLSDQWLFQEEDRGNKRRFFVFDVTDKTRTPLQVANDLSGMIVRSDNEQLTFNQEVLERFKNSEYVYFASESRFNIAIALGSDFKDNPDSSLVLILPAIRYGWDETAIADFLNKNSISYVELKSVYYAYSDEPLPSHNRKFLAEGTRIITSDGANLVQTQEHYGTINGWAYDDSGVYFQLPGVRGGPILMPLFSTGKAEPILKLNVPQGYLQE